MLLVAAVQSVHRHPVGAVYEYAFAVDVERKVAAFLWQVVHRIHIKTYGAETYLATVCVKHSAVLVN